MISDIQEENKLAKQPVFEAGFSRLLLICFQNTHIQQADADKNLPSLPNSLYTRPGALNSGLLPFFIGNSSHLSLLKNWTRNENGNKAEYGFR